MEYQRSVDGAGNVYQWVDSHLFMVVDTVTGEPQRFAGDNRSLSSGPIEAALAYVARRIGWEDRLAIIRVECIRAFRTGVVVQPAEQQTERRP